MRDENDSTIKLDNERLKIAVDAWKYVVSVQMHFNDIEMKIRNLYFTILAATLGLVGVLQGKKVTVYPDLKISLTLFVIAAMIPISMLFYFIDRHWYHRLLQGAVAQGVAIEERYKDVLPEIQLGSKIAEASPVKFGWFGWKWIFFFLRDERFRKHANLHSDQKIELLYKSVMFGALAVIIVYGSVAGVQVQQCTLVTHIFGSSCFMTPSDAPSATSPTAPSGQSSMPTNPAATGPVSPPTSEIGKAPTERHGASVEDGT